MRYYVIINGINSLTIPGLAIKDLPPISKTLMRNNKETIDGRDGDIITELGYSAYDKALTIGLYGSYDINDIIAFFNQKGTIVFSDEPDKYYNFTILDQIDYDKLVKFRTATIRIHCQPFKYPLTETPEEMELKFVTGTGTDLTLNNTAEAKISLNLQGNTHQETTTGKNLLPSTLTTQTLNDVQITKNSDGSVTLNGTTNASTDFKWFEGSITLEAGTYYIGLISTSNNFNLYTIGSNGINVLQNPVSNSYVTLTLSETTTITRLSSYANSGKTFNNQTFYPMICKGLPFDYEKFTYGASPNPDYPQEVQVVTGNNTITISNSDNTQSQEYEINLGTLELCKKEDYQDYIYGSPNNWYKHTKIGKITLNGSESIATTNFSNLYWVGKSALNIDYLTGDFSDNFKYIEDSRIIDNTTANNYLGDNQISFRLGTNKDRLYIKSTNFATATDLQTWLTTHNTILYYVLATPTEEQITNAELIEQLNNLYYANSYQDQTNISQENDNMPFIIWAIALRKGSNEAVINNIGNTVSKPTISITGSGILEIYLNGTQMLSVDMSSDTNIVIDTQNLEAYNPTTMQLKNRKVTGDYSKFVLPPGNSTIKVTGYFTNVTITNYTRWL